MDEIDVFVSLLDDIDADNILRFLKQNMKTGSLDFKKARIRILLRSGGKQRINPMFNVARIYKTDLLSNLNEKEFTWFIASDNIMGDAQKFANFILYYPKKLRDLMPSIEDNINKNISWNTFEFPFETEEELKNYEQKISIFPPALKVKKFLIQRLINQAFKDGKIEDIPYDLVEKIKEYSLLDMYRESCKKEYPLFVLEYAYISTHESIPKDLEAQLEIDIISRLMDIYPMDNLIKQETEDDKDKEIEMLKERIKSLDSKAKQVDNKYKSDIKALKQQLNNKDKKHKVEVEKLSSKIMQFSKEYDEISNRSKEYSDRLEKMEMYLSEVFQEEAGITPLFAFILNDELFNTAHITKCIFKEILLLPVSNWKSQVNGIKKIYIQREGISSKKIESVKSYCKEHLIPDCIVSIQDEKVLIELIAIIKYRIGDVKYGLYN